MGAYWGCLMIYVAIMAHGCDVKKAAEIQAEATLKAAQVKCQ